MGVRRTGPRPPQQPTSDIGFEIPNCGGDASLGQAEMLRRPRKSSGLARMTIPGSGVYGAMNAGLETLTRYMAKELGARKITANIFAPGAIATDVSCGMVRENPEINCTGCLKGCALVCCWAT
jgi:Enoyl-(Acyl carrier protein) reductase